MSRILTTPSPEAKNAVSNLFARGGPVLVEARFPKMAVASDWHLCQDEEDLEEILERLGPGVEVHISSVWDLKNPGEICLRK